MADEEDPREYALAHQAWFTGVAGRYYVRRTGRRAELRPDHRQEAHLMPLVQQRAPIRYRVVGSLGDLVLPLICA